MTTPITIRRATTDDAGTITIQRRAMFTDMGVMTTEGLNNMDRAFLPWVIDHIMRGDYLGWLAVTQVEGREVAVAGAGLLIHPWLPRYDDPRARRAYILNVYTHPDYRQRGLARQLVEIILEYCKADGFKAVTLHASDQGRSIYEAMGFKATNEMRIELGD
jgi:ribosomal protein S18 acetylase RimI-like enzyme